MSLQIFENLKHTRACFNKCVTKPTQSLMPAVYLIDWSIERFTKLSAFCGCWFTKYKLSTAKQGGDKIRTEALREKITKCLVTQMANALIFVNFILWIVEDTTVEVSLAIFNLAWASSFDNHFVYIVELVQSNGFEEAFKCLLKFCMLSKVCLDINNILKVLMYLNFTLPGTRQDLGKINRFFILIKFSSALVHTICNLKHTSKKQAS